MALGSAELARLEKLLDTAELLTLDFLEVASSESAGALLKLSNRRDFVLGAAYAYAMTTFAQASKANLSETDAVELLSVVFLRLSRMDPYKLAAKALAHSAGLEDLK